MYTTKVSAKVTPRVLANSIEEFQHLENLYLCKGKDGCQDVPEAIGRLTNLKMLVIECGTTVIPPSIGDLKNLEELVIENSPLLTELPASIGELPELCELSIRDTSVSLLPSMKNLKSLAFLDLTNTKITKLPPSIVELNCLGFLDLSNTDISELPVDIGKLKGLTVINLPDSNISSVPPSIIQLYRNLEELWLGGTRITKFPEELSGFHLLNVLDLSNTQISVLPPSIGEFTSLTRLYLANTKITHLPEDFGGQCDRKIADWLTELDVSGCMITTFPRSFCKVKSLRKLELGNTAISQLPREILNLDWLETLDLSGCRRMTALPSFIGKMKSIGQLFLGNTVISQLPSEIRELQRLQILDLSDCSRMTDLPSFIGEMKSLKKLVLRNLAISQLPSEIGHLTNLEHLDLVRTNVTELPPAIGNLSGLRELILTGSKISKLPDEFANLRNLKDLSLCDSLMTGAFAKWKSSSLGHLGASVLPPPIFELEKLHTLRTIDIACDDFGPEKLETFRRFLLKDMLKLVERRKSLTIIDVAFDLFGSEQRKKLHSALRLNGAVQKVGSVEAVEWPVVLSNASRAFDGAGLRLFAFQGDVQDGGVENVGHGGKYTDDVLAYAPVLGKPDDIYPLLKEFQGSFVQMIQNAKVSSGSRKKLGREKEEARNHKRARILP